MMTLEEAIKHCKDVALSCTNKECALEHFQLLKWLQEYSNILEKQGEQKSADMVEPKFHKGEWITNGDYTWKIIEVKPLDYILQSQDGNIVDDTISHVDEQFHSFTIEGAKDGDVLTTDTWTFIFKKYQDKSVSYHCAASAFNDFSISDTGEFDSNYVHPATKEQRDTLMEAMANYGWKFDFEKKKLKKIWNETEISFGAKDSELQEVSYYIPEGFHVEIDGNRIVIKR